MIVRIMKHFSLLILLGTKTKIQRVTELWANTEIAKKVDCPIHFMCARQKSSDRLLSSTM